MNDTDPAPSNEGIGVSLVGGDSTILRSRQMMLRSDGYDVRSYATGAALLADPRSRDYPCIIVDDQEALSISLLRAMRETGWRGKGIILNGTLAGSSLMDDADKHGDKMFEGPVSDASLLAAVASTIYRGWAGWNAV